MTNKYETLNSQVERLSQEILCLKQAQRKHSKHCRHFFWKRREHQQLRCPFDAEHVHTDSCGIERNIRGTFIMMDEARNLVSGIKAMIPDADLNKFNWELIDRYQGNFDIKMMALL